MLRPGGRLALTDIVVLARQRGALLRGVSAACRVPGDNLCTVEEYRERLVSAGFEQVQIRTITAEVLGGFGAFMSKHWRSQILRHPSLGWIKLIVTGLGGTAAVHCATTNSSSCRLMRGNSVPRVPGRSAKLPK